MPLTQISVRGAREHNLKDVSVDIPRDTLTVITGLSGSGKSSLAFDTIYAEGQRRYVESLSAYARQFLELMQKPDVDHIEGLSPAISIEQKTTSRNPRSTVATVTEIYDYMRLLWARVGIPYSPATGEPIAAQTVSQMVDRVMTLPEGTRLYLLAPVVRGRKGEYRKELAEWLRAGFTRVRIDGEVYEIDEAPALDKKYKHDIEVVVDRLVVRPDIATRLADSFETALKLADGPRLCRPRPTPPSPRRPRTPRPAPKSGPRQKLKGAGVPGRIVFSEKFACPVSGLHHRRDRAAPVLVQRPAGRVPGVRRARREADLRRGPGRPQPRALHQEGRGRPLGEVQPPVALLHAGAGQPRARVRLQPRHALEGPARARSATSSSTAAGGKPVTLTFVDGKKILRRPEAVRGRDRQPQPPHAPDRERVDARGARQVPVAAAVRDLPRRAPQARGAGGQGRDARTSATRRT